MEAIDEAIAGEEPSPSPSPSFEDALQEYLMRRPIEVPVVEHPAHAGHSGSAVIDYVYVDRPSGVDKELLCIPVKGDCMAPRVQPGDRVIVERERWPEQGEMVVAVVNEEVYLRRFYKTNSHIILKADNPSYPDLEVTEADIVGVVVQAIWKP